MVDEFGSDLAIIGTYDVIDPQGINIVTGRHKYSYDHNMAGKLYAALLGSPYAHANIVSIDTSRAEALEGVKAVITYEDNPNWSQELLCWGHEVAAVAAVDEQTAERALDLIDVEYEVLPFVIDPEEAMQPNAVLVGTFDDGNVSPNPTHHERGDIEQGFAEADVIIEETVGWFRPHTQNTIEPPSGMAWWEGDDVYGYDQNQNTFSNNRSNASALGIPINRSHFHSPWSGGGFGGGGQTREPTTCALLAKKAGLPVAIRRPRRLGTTSRRNHYSPKLHMKLGCKNDGTMTAFECTWYGHGGRNASSGGSNYWQTVESTWICPNFVTDVWGVATNTGVGSGHRCLAHPEAGATTDLVLEKMAAALGMNLLEFYRKVFITPDMDNQDNGQAQANHGLRPALEKAAAEIGYEAKIHAPGTSTLPDGRMHGIGIHAHNDRHGTTTGTRGCIINVHRDGTATFNSGGTRMSGGPEVMKAIIAETLGLRYDQVHIATWGNPDASADGGSQAGSTHSANAGSAAQVAAWDVRKQLFEVAAGELGVNPEDLDARLGEIFVKTDPTQSITHGEVVSNVPRYSRPIIGKGVSYGSFLRKPVGNHEIGEPAWHRTGVATAYEVAVDTETGEVEILDYVNVVDTGRVINRWGCEGQILTGQATQLGKAFLWDVQHDPGTGTLLSANLIDDKMATAMDVNIAKNKGVLLETINAIGPYGLQGIGEPAACPGYAALLNAVNNAIGVQLIVRPITPRVILKALGKA